MDIQQRRESARMQAQARLTARKEQFVMALYTPSEMERALRTLRSSGDTLSTMIRLQGRGDGSMIYDVLRGADALGRNQLSTEEILAMNGGDLGRLRIHGQTEAALHLRAVAELQREHPGVAVTTLVKAELALREQGVTSPDLRRQAVAELLQPTAVPDPESPAPSAPAPGRGRSR